MATYEKAANKLVTCPYDNAHKVKESRYQLHISKCKQNHLDNNMDICPFNAQHRVTRGTLDHHIMQCEDRGPLDRQLAASASSQNDQFRGHTGVPSYHSPHIETNENWDTEASRVPVPGYKPKVEPPNGGIRTDFGLMKPSQRRQYYKNLHGRSPNDVEAEEIVEETLPVLRPPKTVSKAQQRDQQNPVHELQNIGLGRGQPAPLSSSRIAANIFGQQAIPGRQPNAAPKSDVPLANLGMGRGGPPANLGGVRNGDHGAVVGPAPQVLNVDASRPGFGRSGRK